jgi:hypothetical protein
MSMSEKDYNAIAAAIRQHITYNGNSNPTKDLIRVLANVFGEINPRFDRTRFFDACDWDATCIPAFYQGDLAAALRQYKQAHPEAQMGDGIKALAKMVEDAGGNPGEFIAFVTHNPIPEALRSIPAWDGCRLVSVKSKE